MILPIHKVKEKPIFQEDKVDNKVLIQDGEVYDCNFFCNIHNAHTQTAHEYISNMDLSTKIMYIALKQFLLQTFVVADK